LQYGGALPWWWPILDLSEDWSTPPWEIAPDANWPRVKWLGHAAVRKRLLRIVRDDPDPGESDHE